VASLQEGDVIVVALESANCKRRRKEAERFLATLGITWLFMV